MCIFHIIPLHKYDSTCNFSDQKKGGNVAVMGANDKGDFLLCNLNTRTTSQQVLDLQFGEGEKVSFYTTGQGKHTTNWIVFLDNNLYQSFF